MWRKGQLADDSISGDWHSLFFELPDVPDFLRVRQSLASGERVSDRDFDRILPDSVRNLSRIHWTPVEVARCAIEWLVERPGARVLDVGSGIGKFSVIGALSSKGAFFGIEQRSSFVRLARDLVSHYRIARVSFSQGDATAADWTGFDAIYLFNPFCESLHPIRQIDLEVPAGRSVYRDYLKATREKLERVRVGTRVVLYHGFGGKMPDGYSREEETSMGGGKLELWIKTK